MLQTRTYCTCFAIQISSLPKLIEICLESVENQWLVAVAERSRHRQGRQARQGIAKQCPRKTLANLCVLRALGGDKELAQQQLARDW
jgi:hypothetical protein